MTDTWRGVGTGAAVGAVGVLLYLLIKNLGGPGERGRGGGGKATVPSLLQPPAALPLPPPRDLKRLTFVMQQASPNEPAVFRARDEAPGAKAYTLEEMISRIRAGGRADVTLKATGAVPHGAIEAAVGRLKQAGLEVWKEAASGIAQVSGHTRGLGRLDFGLRSVR